MKNASLRLLAFLVLLSVLGGCAGYRLGSIGGKNIQGVNSIYIPVVKNRTLEPSIDVATTAAIIRAFDQDGTVATSQNEAADGVLEIMLTEVRRQILQPEQLDAQAGNQFQIVLVAHVSFFNRKTGRKVIQDAAVSGSNSYFVGRDQVEAERQAVPMAEQDLAKKIVSLVVEGW
ncbi:MAG: LPS assembly lipoprotein LptE [Verrucomicrobium sp.]|nr:LPS assembly lipoprotein LptE [Verrucomicrobium sp.]